MGENYDFKEREPGYYWVCWDGEWLIAKWLANSKWWYMPIIGPVDVRVAGRLDDGSIEVNETRIIGPHE